MITHTQPASNMSEHLFVCLLVHSQIYSWVNEDRVYASTSESAMVRTPGVPPQLLPSTAITMSMPSTTADNRAMLRHRVVRGSHWQ
jgi:hypothetical protein